MRKHHLVIFLTFTVLSLLFMGNVAAQRSSYNSWDRVVFRGNLHFNKRLFNLSEINLGYGARYLDQPYEIRRTGISTLIGYRYSRAITIGLGTGLEAYNGGSMVPVYMEGQIYLNRLNQGSIKLFLSGASGFLFHVSGIETNINVFANPGIGLLIPATYRSSLSIGLGVYTHWDPGVERYSFINTKIGLLFY